MKEQVNPKFSVVMVDYEESASRHELRRAVECFTNQTYKNFELLIYHDGPKKQSYQQDLENCKLPENIKFFESEVRENNWGHSNRNRGIHQAAGEWIIHTNADNVFYPFALQEMVSAIEYENWTVNPDNSLTSDWDALVFPIIMKGYAPRKRRITRLHEQSDKLSVVLSCVPIKVSQIDTMQFVMKKKTWLEKGGWSDLSFDSDGKLYERFAKEVAVFQIPRILAEHH